MKDFSLLLDIYSYSEHLIRFELLSKLSKSLAIYSVNQMSEAFWVEPREGFLWHALMSLSCKMPEVCASLVHVGIMMLLEGS